MNDVLTLNDSLKSAIQIAQAVAKENSNEKFSSAHLLLGLLHKTTGLDKFLESINKDVSFLKEWAEVHIEEYPKSAKVPSDPAGDETIQKVIEEADNIRIKLGLLEINPICAITALSKPNIGFSSEQLKSFPLREKEILDLYVNDSAIMNALTTEAGKSTNGSSTNTKNSLLKFCTDKTSIAKEGKLDPIIGRDRELRMMIEILGRRSKPNVILIGDPGVGKTALVDGFALNIVSGNVPDSFANALIFELDLGSLFAGASYKGEVEDRLKSILTEIKQFDNAILFIDEIHILLDPKGAAGAGAANLLKPELARGEITVIGATTTDEYRKIIEPEAAFSRRFETLLVEEPDLTTTIKMINQLLPAYEKHHNFKVAKDAIDECVRLAKRYIKDRRLPDAAIDLLDRSMSAIKMMEQSSLKELNLLSAELEKAKNNGDGTPAEKLKDMQWFTKLLKDRLSPVLLGQLEDETEPEKIEDLEALVAYLEKTITRLKELLAVPKDSLDKQDVASVIAHKTGIPIGKIQAGEKEKLLHMEDYLKKRVIGQDHALKAIAEAIIESRSGLNKAGQPIGSFFFLGPTGTGKTEVAKSIADFLFNDEKAMIRFDMSEFKEEHSAALLYGAPPGYVGYEEGGMLVNEIRKKPYSVVLFDEIEKAHPSVFDIFLQILDEGKIHDRLGKEGDFSNALILFTSNIGSDFIIEKFGKDEMPKSNELMEIMTKYFRPEFLARLTEIIPFAPISEKNVVTILNVHAKGLLDTLTKLGITLNIDEEAKNKLAMLGFTPKYGARPITGVIRTYLRRPISRMLVSGEIKKGNVLNLKLKEDKSFDWVIS